MQEGIPEVIPVEACYLGWQESLVLPAKLVEARIPGSVQERPRAGISPRLFLDSLMEEVLDEKRWTRDRSFNNVIFK